MTDNEQPALEPRPDQAGLKGGAPPERPERPERPSLRSENPPPVLVKQPPPISVRVCQLLWALSFAAGAVNVVYYFVVREDQLPLISDAIRAIDGSRVTETYESASDLVYWLAFAVMVGLLLVQITLLVSFMGRRRGVRWWQLATVLAQILLYAILAEMVAVGEHGVDLRQLMVAQCGLALMALLTSTLPRAIDWTAQQNDVRRGALAAGAEI